MEHSVSFDRFALFVMHESKTRAKHEMIIIGAGEQGGGNLGVKGAGMGEERIQGGRNQEKWTKILHHCAVSCTSKITKRCEPPRKAWELGVKKH